MESHLGYRFCNVPGTEPPEVLSFYTEIRSHAGTWAFHEQHCRERCEALLFEARNLVDDTRQVSDELASGSVTGIRLDALRALLDGARQRASKQANKAAEAASGLREFHDHASTNLGARLEEKLKLIEGGVHDTEVFGQRAVMRRQRQAIIDLERAYLRVVDADGFDLMGRRIERTVYGEGAVEAHDALEAAIHEYKKTVGQVAIQHRLLKSLGHRRVALANASLVARSAAQALGHLATTWATTAGAFAEAIVAWDAAKTQAERVAAVAPLATIAEAWSTVESLGAANDDVFG
jgi:hypothetical protein